jgi:hypothetical protein
MSATAAPPDPSVRSPAYYVARASAPCPDCGLTTRLLALALPQLHEVLDADADDVKDEWQRTDANAFLFYVAWVSEDVMRRLERLSRFYRPARSAATHDTYWANHCEHCATLLDDHGLHCEPDGAFSPSSEAAAANIELLTIDEPFEAAASGYTLEPEFFGAIPRR